MKSEESVTIAGMAGYESRRAAFSILLEQEQSGAFLKDLFNRDLSGLDSRDRGLVREMCYGVLRNKTLLDYNIDLYTPKKLGNLKLRVLLRLTAYQVFFLDAVPDFAAVNTGVELVKRLMDKHQAGFANAVLKKVVNHGLRTYPGNTLKALSINTSHPLWLLQRWNKTLGQPRTREVAERNNEEAEAWIRINPMRASVAEIQEQLQILDVECEQNPLAPLFLKLKSRTAEVLNSALFTEGKISFQDPASFFVAKLMAWQPGLTLLDLCAAPGGKAACLLEMRAVESGGEGWGEGEDEGELVANDISFSRLRRIRDARLRLGHSGLLPLVMDPAHSAVKHPFDVVLVDAPCSNLGVLRRRPEAKWSHSPQSLERLAERQKDLLERAAGLAARPGSIVYATCSPEEEETWDVVQNFLNRHGEWALEDAGLYVPSSLVKQKCLWMYPGETPFDGFFAARLTRK